MVRIIRLCGVQIVESSLMRRDDDDDDNHDELMLGGCWTCDCVLSTVVNEMRRRASVFLWGTGLLYVWYGVCG
jgi:hypothetical protein